MEEEYKGYRIEVMQDDDPLNPRVDCDNISDMYCFHNRYLLGDRDHDLSTEDFAGWGEMYEHLSKDSAAILPIFMYDHSGITINTTGFACPWDSGQIGFIRITKKAAKENWKEYSEDQLLDILRSDVEVYDQYLRGDVYGYTIYDSKDNDVDSCWSIFGEDEALKQAKEEIDAMWKHQHALFTEAGVEVEV